MTNVDLNHLWQQVLDTVNSDQPDPELFLDIYQVVQEQQEEIARLTNLNANLLARLAILDQLAFEE